MTEFDLSLLDEFRIIAQNGLEYTEDPYDKERYNRILDLVSKQYSKPIDLSKQEVRDRFENQLGHVTPNIGGRAAVINETGQILLMKRADDGTWGSLVDMLKPTKTQLRRLFVKQKKKPASRFSQLN